MGTPMSLQYWFQSTKECSLPICNSCWASATDTPSTFQIGRPSICHKCKCDFSKKLLCLMLIPFLQTFTGQCQVTSSTTQSKACSLQWWLQVGQIICVASSPYCQHHLMHSWWSSIKQAQILTKDVLSKIAWSGTSATAIMTDHIQNGITKWKSIFLCQIRNVPKEK